MLPARLEGAVVERHDEAVVRADQEGARRGLGGGRRTSGKRLAGRDPAAARVDRHEDAVDGSHQDAPADDPDRHGRCLGKIDRPRRLAVKALERPEPSAGTYLEHQGPVGRGSDGDGLRQARPPADLSRGWNDGHHVPVAARRDNGAGAQDRIARQGRLEPVPGPGRLEHERRRLVVLVDLRIPFDRLGVENRPLGPHRPGRLGQERQAENHRQRHEARHRPGTRPPSLLHPAIIDRAAGDLHRGRPFRWRHPARWSTRDDGASGVPRRDPASGLPRRSGGVLFCTALRNGPHHIRPHIGHRQALGP